MWADLNNIYVWTLIFVSLSLGALGLIDDMLKIKQKNSSGLKSRYKFFGQVIISVLALVILINYSDHEFLFNLYFPFLKILYGKWDYFLYLSDYSLLLEHPMQ